MGPQAGTNSLQRLPCQNKEVRGDREWRWDRWLPHSHCQVTYQPPNERRACATESFNCCATLASEGWVGRGCDQQLFSGTRCSVAGDGLSQNHEQRGSVTEASGRLVYKILRLPCHAHVCTHRKRSLVPQVGHRVTPSRQGYPAEGPHTLLEPSQMNMRKNLKSKGKLAGGRPTCYKMRAVNSEGRSWDAREWWLPLNGRGPGTRLPIPY